MKIVKNQYWNLLIDNTYTSESHLLTDSGTPLFLGDVVIGPLEYKIKSV